MATKTISIDLEAYERLKAARRSADESFSRVIERPHWRSEIRTTAVLLDAIADLPTVPHEVLARLEETQKTDAPPQDRWRSG